MKIYCSWCEKYHLLTEIAELDWIRLDEKGVTAHIVAKCPDCGQEHGYTFRKPVPRGIE